MFGKGRKANYGCPILGEVETFTDEFASLLTLLTRFTQPNNRMLAQSKHAGFTIHFETIAPLFFAVVLNFQIETVSAIEAIKLFFRFCSTARGAGKLNVFPE